MPELAKTADGVEVDVIEMVGVSATSWADAAREAVARASVAERHITGLDVQHTTAVVRDGKIVSYHVDVKLACLAGHPRVGN